MIEMTDERAAEVLAAHNEWRRYDGFPGEPGAPTMGDPAELGRAIDHVVSRFRSQPPAEAQPVALDYAPGELDRTAPENIWLQIDTSSDNSGRQDPWPGADGVTWQDESVGGLEIQYVRADLVSPPSAPVGVEGLVRDLVREIERNTCAHEDTHRGGAIWEICDACGARWADDRGGRPDFKWPDCVERAHAWLAQQPAAVEVVAEVQRLRAENRRLMMVCQSAHDRLLRGDEDAEVLALLEDAWTGPAEAEANPARGASSAATMRSLTHDKEPK